MKGSNNGTLVAERRNDFIAQTAWITTELNAHLIDLIVKLDGPFANSEKSGKMRVAIRQSRDDETYVVKS